MKTLFLVVLILFSMSSLALSEPETDYFPLTKGSYWIYQDQIEVQNPQGNFEAYNKYQGEKVRVKRINQLCTLKVISTEKRDDFKIAKIQEEGTPQGIITFFYVVDNKSGKIYNYSNEQIKMVLPNNKDVNIKGSPAYIFPLQIDSRWGDPDDLKRKDNMYIFYVEKIEDVTVPAGTFRNCFKIIRHTVANKTIQWFCPNVGIVKLKYRHHGTIENLTSELKEVNLTSLLTFAKKGDVNVIPSGEETEAMYINKAMVNGNHWKSFKDQEKEGYLFGYEDGLINTAIYYLPDKEKRDEVISSLPTSTGDMPIDDLIGRIDEFYSNAKNLNIPVSYVLLIIRNRLIGVDEKGINEYIKYLRNSFGKERGER